jgi:hypothetical protein
VFPHLKNVYTPPMRLSAAFLLFLLLPIANHPTTPPQPTRELYDALNALRLDPSSVYQITPENHIELRRGDAKVSFDQGELIFFQPLNSQITGAVFFGRGHILTLPRDTIERQQLARFLGSPILDQDFASAYLRFTDDTADDLHQQLHSAAIQSELHPDSLTRWEPIVAVLNPAQSLRIAFGALMSSPQPYFYASLDGIATGPFDLLVDPMRSEPFLLGQVHKSSNTEFYDTWASYKLIAVTSPPPGFHALHYSIETSIALDHALDATATIKLHSQGTGDRLLIFGLSRALNVDSVTTDNNRPLEYFQNQNLTPQDRSVRGSDYLLVALPAAMPRNAEFSIRLHYHGDIIVDAGNNVLFVGAHESWYPHLGDASDFATYDLTMRWPRRLRLIATGTKLDETDDGAFRVGHWKPEKPISVAGFNLGEYSSASVPSPGYTVDVYANRQVEQELTSRLSNSAASDLEGRVNLKHPGLNIGPGIQPLPPNPAAGLKQLGKDIDASIHFYETYSGPFPFHNLSVSQIPGTFGQGWPGLLYVSTYSFLSTDVQRRAGLTSISQEHFTDLVPFHEVAHQWWGNTVGWSSYRDQWINEAIANYLTLLFADARKTPEHALHLWLQRYRQNLVEKAPNADEPADRIGALALGSRLNSSKSPRAYEDLIYAKGTWVMHMLREMLRQPGPNPDARFISLFHTLIAKYSGRALTTADLQREVEAIMTPAMDLEGGHSMEWFFAQWVQGTGTPHYRVEFSTHKTATAYVIHGKLFQSSVPPSFIARVPIYATNLQGHATFLGTIVAAAPETQFTLTSPISPHKLQIDPQQTLLCTTPE